MALYEQNTHHSGRLDRIGMIARWRPVHLGHAPVLRALCDSARQAFIGIGSSNRYDLRNPFTLEETTDMIRLVLAERSNYTLMPIPDLDDGPKWRQMILDRLGTLDLFVTDNPYVASLLSADYSIVRPVALVPPVQKVAVDGTMVRSAMAHGDGWRDLVPPEIAGYISSNELDKRFRREFGLEALARELTVRRSPSELSDSTSTLR